MCLWARKQRAVRKRMEEPFLADPTPFFDDFAVHHGDLSGWAAERLQRYGAPRPRSSTQGDAGLVRFIGVESAQRCVDHGWSTVSATMRSAKCSLIHSVPSGRRRIVCGPSNPDAITVVATRPVPAFVNGKRWISPVTNKET